MAHHRVLQRQMRKSGVRPDVPPSSQEAWAQFIEHVDRFYHEADQDRYLLERSLSISSHEMQDLYEQLLETSESRVAAERDKLRTVISSLGAGLCTLDEQGRVLSINPEGERLLGCTEGEVLGQSFFAWTITSGDGQAPRCWLEEAVASGQLCREEEGVFLRKDGTRLPVSYTINPIIEESALRGAVLVFFDLTERKQAEEALRESEGRLRGFVNALPGLALILDEEGRYMEVFTTEDHLLYAEVAQLKGRCLQEVLPETLAALFLKTIRQAIDSGAPQTLEYALDVLSGPHWFEGRVAPMPGLVGERRLVVWISHDITERKRAEEALRESEQRFRDLFESSPDAIFVEDFDGNVLDVNPAACRLHGSTPERLVGTNVRALVPPDQREEALAAFQEMVRGALDRVEGWSSTADGREVPVEIRASRITQDHKPALLLQVRDITERKKAQQRLTLLEASVSASLDGITISDARAPDYPLIYVSPGFERMTGYAAAEVLGRNSRFLQHEDHDQPDLDEIRRAIKAGTQCRVVLRNYRKDGALFWNELTLYPLHDGAGRLTHYVGIQRDITERKQVEEALRRSEERYALAVGSGNVSVWDWNLETQEIYVDPSLKQVLGYEDHQIKDHLDDLLKLVHPDDRERLMAAARAHIDGVDSFYEVEHRLVHRQGGVRWFVSRGTAVQDAHGKPVRMAGTSTDITERKQGAQELARINAKLEQRNRELQDFAYVASHDLQEPLRKIRAFADLMQEDYGDEVDATGHYYLDRMQDAAARMSGLIADLLAYSRIATDVHPFDRVDLNAVVAHVLSDLEMQIEETRGRITVSNLPSIEADATQMHQLLQNFIGNALKFHKPDAPPLVEVVGCLEQKPAPEEGLLHTVCRLEVRDNGIGFDEKYLDRIFTPFQRLHGRSKYAGTGMGLAICRRIVERHHGAITVRSTPGEGATFVVTLPASQTPARREPGTA